MAYLLILATCIGLLIGLIIGYNTCLRDYQDLGYIPKDTEL